MEAEVIKRKPRTFIPENWVLKTWEDIVPYTEELKNRELKNASGLLQWLKDRSEIGSAVEDEYRWRYVRQTCDTENEDNRKAYEYFVQEISPKLMLVANELDQKVAYSGLLEKLDTEKYKVYIRSLKNALELFREENISYFTEQNMLEQEYGITVGAMTIEHEGTEITMPKAQKLLQSADRKLREEVYHKIVARRLQDKDKLNELFDKLLHIRHQIALNAGFENYRDYKLQELGRFDYGVKECESFHDAIASEVIPLVKIIHEHRKEKMGLKILRPYDLDADISGSGPLQPFKGQGELVEKSVKTLQKVDNYFSWCVATMDKMHHLDLESRKGKAPGGYNMEFKELSVPFIFMNAAGTDNDVRVMAHEGGHAVQSFLMRGLEFDFEKDITSEIAELASMSMELFVVDRLDTFYTSAAEQKRAKTEHLEGIILMLPWIATIDKFQHWLYTHPGHSVAEREAAWMDIHKEFSTGLVDWKGLEEDRKNRWQRQLHLFEVPFYYIEYGIAQMGAIAMYRNFKRNPVQTVENYKKGLSLGYTKTIPEMYETAGIKFDFSKKYVKELMAFLEEELKDK